MTCRLQEIFSRQQDLIHQFQPVEIENGFNLVTGFPVDISHRFGQYRIRDGAWRLTEELVEATMSLEEQKGWDDFCVELIDGLHFLVELCIACGIGPDHLNYGVFSKDRLEGLYEKVFPEFYLGGEEEGYKEHNPEPMSGPIERLSVDSFVYQVIHNLGRAINLLKNKPWKQSHKEPDHFEFRDRMVAVFHSYIRLLGEMGISPQQAYDLYVNKNQVNQERLVAGV